MEYKYPHTFKSIHKIKKLINSSEYTQQNKQAKLCANQKNISFNR